MFPPSKTVKTLPISCVVGCLSFLDELEIELTSPTALYITLSGVKFGMVPIQSCKIWDGSYAAKSL